MREKIVCIEWVDACSNSGAYDDKDPERFTPIKTKTVGHLIKSTPKTIIVSQDRIYLNSGKIDGDRHISIIPRGMIRKVTELKG